MSIGGSGPSAIGRLILDASGVTAGASQATAAIGNINAVSGSTYFGLRNLGLGFEVLGGAAAASLTLATSQAIGWESAMVRIQTSTENAAGTSAQAAGDFSVVEQGLRNIAITSPFTITSIEQVGKAMADEGLRGTALVATTQEVLRLNALTGISTDLLATFLGKAGAAFGFSDRDARGFASALLAVTQNTAATTADVISLFQRLASGGREAGIGAEGVLGLAAAIASVPQNARLAGTAFSLLIQQISDAVGKGGPQLQLLANVTNETTDQFVSDFATKPEAAIAHFIENLGALKDNLSLQQAVLDGLSIKSVKTQQAIIGVADAQGNLANSSSEVSNAITIVDTAFAQAELTQREMNRVTDTTSAQLAILHNNVNLAAQSFGAVLLPIITPVIRVFSTMITGLSEMPPQLQLIIGGFLAVTAVLGITIGTFLILLPRILQGAAAFGNLTAALRGTAVALDRVAIAENFTAADAQALIQGFIDAAATADIEDAALQALIASQLELAGVEAALAGETAALALEEGAEAAAANLAAASTASFGTTAAIATGGLTILTGLLAVGAMWLFNHGQAARDAAAANQDVVQSDESLVAALQREANGVAFATDQWILHKLAIDGALDSLSKAGVGADVTVGVVKGTGTPQDVSDIRSKLAGTPGVTADDADAALKSLQELNGTYEASMTAASSLSAANAQLGISEGDVASGANAASTALNTMKEQAAALANAIFDLPNAETRVAQGAIDIANANEAMVKATVDVIDKALLEKIALEEVAKATYDLVVAQDNATQAARNLSRARTNAWEDAFKAWQELQSAQLSEERAALRVKDAQKALDEARAHDKTKDLTKATNELHDAQLRLVNANLAVSDAEWQLQYLMEEGASSRDILDAQLTLEGAKNAVADATDNVATSQDNLNKVNAEDPNEAILKAELDLAQAVLDHDNAVIKVYDDTVALKDKQDDYAADVAYHQAVADAASANLAVDQALRRVHLTLVDLHAIQNGSIERAYEQQVLRLRESYISLAFAETDLQVDQDALNGKFDTATDKVSILSEKLKELGRTANPLVAGDIYGLGEVVGGAGLLLGGMGLVAGDTGKVFQDTLRPGVNNTKGALMNLGGQIDNTGQNFWDFVQGPLWAVENWLNTNIPGFEALDSWLHTIATSLSDFVTSDVFSSFMDFVAGSISLGSPLGAIGTIIGGIGGLFSEGGYFDRPTLGIFGEAGPELLLPLNNERRMNELLSQHGIFDMMNKSKFASASGAPVYGQGGGLPVGTTNNIGGDTVQLTAITTAAPEDIIDEFRWYKRVRAS